jgi:superoxide dismutase, Fe-Mn family
MAPHVLPSLLFPLDALQPYISEETLRLHHGKHHQGYIDKLNQLLPGTGLENAPLEEILIRADGPLLDNAGQHWNHSFYWNCLRPAGGHGPKGELLDALRGAFGTLEDFRENFVEAAVGIFGSGWTWLVVDPSGIVSIETTPNGENPLRAGRTPLLACDVWEHAYYVDYRNDRARFVNSTWDLVNWDFVQRCWNEQVRRAA